MGTMESGTAGLGQDETNPVVMVNGLMPTSVNAGDVLALHPTPSIGMSFGSLAGAGLVVDFVPAPEPSTMVLGVLGMAGLIAWRMSCRRNCGARNTSNLG
ncbi:MAG: PEP-CTERM sorting domain-containing protein [Planctomycetia bacterium]|nr:PEP-CTERM sorting domain-containing protein [Planctomycetia bacterium]